MSPAPVPAQYTYVASYETLVEVERVCRNVEFFEARRPHLGAGSKPDVVYFETEPEVIVAEGITRKPLSKRKLNDE